MLRPLGNRLLVKQAEARKQSKGIILPDTIENVEFKAVVIAVGPGKKMLDGSVVSLGITPGDTILYSRYAGQDMQISGEVHKVLTIDDVLGIFGKEE